MRLLWQAWREHSLRARLDTSGVLRAVPRARFGQWRSPMRGGQAMSTQGFTKIREARSRGYGWSPDKWQCDTCLRVGYGLDDGPYQWANACRRGHSPCAYCGKMLALLIHDEPRVHARCPKRPRQVEQIIRARVFVVDEAREAALGPWGDFASRGSIIVNGMKR